MSKLIGESVVHEEPLAHMRRYRCGECEACKTVESSKKVLAPNPPFEHANDATVECWNKVLADNPCQSKWYAYQNHDLGHYNIGHLQFLIVGPGCTYKEPPQHYPDTKHGLGWRYILVGTVNLESGLILEGHKES